jgi:hypothetical protein
LEKNPGIPDKDQLLCFTGAKQFEDVFADIGHKFDEKLFFICNYITFVEKKTHV